MQRTPGLFIVSAIIWGRIVDKRKPDKYEIIDSIVAVIVALSHSRFLAG